MSNRIAHYFENVAVEQIDARRFARAFNHELKRNYEFEAAGALPEPCVYAALKACGVSPLDQTGTLAELLADGTLKREEALCSPRGVGTMYFLAEKENSQLY